VFGRGSYGQRDDADVGGTKKCSRRRKLVLVTWWCLSNKEGKGRKKVGKLSQVNLQVSDELEAIDLFYSICVRKLQRQPRH
jgi:hypothetical protein